MAESKLSPDQAAALANSPLVQDEEVRQRLSGMGPIQEQVPPAAIAAPDILPEPGTELAQDLTQVPQPDPVIDDAATEALQTELVAPEGELPTVGFDFKTDKDILRERLEDESIPMDERLKILREMQAKNNVSEDAVISAEMKQRSLAVAAQEYQEELAKITEWNNLVTQQGLPESMLKPEPKFSEVASEADLNFMLKSNMDVNPAILQKAAEEVKDIEDAKDLKQKEAIARNLANEEKANATVKSEEAEKARIQAQKAKEDTDKEVDDIEKSYDSLQDMFTNASTGRKVSAAIGIMLGGLAQGLSGASVNPVLDFLDKEFKNNLAAKQAAAKKLQTMVSAKAAQSKSTMDQIKMQKVMAELQRYQMQNEDTMLERRARNYSGSQPIPPEVQRTVPANSKERDLWVNVGKGVTYRGNNEESVSKANELIRDTTPGMQAIEDLIAAIDDPEFNRFNLTDERRAELQTKLGTVVGALRIPLLGPGVMTNEERKFMKELIGDPTKLFTLPDFQKARLKAVKLSIKRGIHSNLSNAGINPPPSAAEKFNNENIAAFKLRNPKASTFQAVQALKKTNLWHEEN